MEVTEIIEQFEWFDGKFKREAVEAAIARREEVIPELLAVLEEIADPAEARLLNAEGDYMAHLYAMFLLAQFRETRAYPLVVRIALLPSDLLESLFSDFITESLPKVLASVCDGNLDGIQSIVENPDADEWVRGAALGSLLNLVVAGATTREEVLEYFASLFHGKLTDKNDVVWSDLVCYCADLYAPQLLGEIERAYDEGLVDSGMIGLDDVKEDFAKGQEWALAQLARNSHRKLVVDTVKEMEGWASFNEKETRPAKDGSLGLPSANPWREDSFTGFKRAAPKVGRNDPCPCGSWKKFKKCCGA